MRSLQKEDESINRGFNHHDRFTIPTEHTLKHLAHVGASVSLGPSVQSPTGPLAPPILLPLVCNPTVNFEHLGSGIKSPTDSNWT